MTGDALSRCVGDAPRFLDEAWGRDVVLRSGADVGGLLDLDDVDALLSEAALRAPAFRLVKAGSPVPPAAYLRSARVGSRTIRDLIDVGRVHEQFADGATVVLQGLHRYWPPLTTFCRDLEQTLSHPVQANAYLTPPVASGLRVHTDAHEVFALHTHGSKHWVAYPAGAALDDLPAPVVDTTVRAGDCLYLPRGAPHAARTETEPSLHITIGVRVVTWRDALRRATGAALADSRYDEALPAGFAADPPALADRLGAEIAELAGRLGAVDPAATADGLADAFVGARPPSLRGQLQDLLALDTIGDDSELARRPGTFARLHGGPEGARLLLGDRELRLPAAAQPALRWILERERFTVRELSDFLDDAGRTVLARRLVREGLLTRAG